ncbi:MAG: hypothetical protein V1929_01090 [bacterium]
MAATFLKRLLLAILAPVVVIGLGEVGLRAAGWGYPTSFLVPREIGGRRVYVDDPFFGYRFFPQRMTRTSAPIVLEKKKAPGVIRVFVLGESAAMGEPQSEFGLSRFLEILLADRAPGKRFEVVNAAMTAINSHVIVEIAHDLAVFQPDCFVLYMGNNEVVGPYGPGTVLENTGRFIRFRVWLTRFRLAQLLRVDRPGPRWSGMEMFNEQRVAADDSCLDAVYNGFQANLNRIVAIARKAGATVVLSTVAVNLRDCAPFAGDKARSAFTEGTFAEARDLDELRFRADSVINQITRNLGNWTGAGVRLVDAEKLFGDAGREVFIDHVHVNPEGNYRLACAIADAIFPATGPVPTLADCLGRMLYTPWNELDLVDGMIQRRRRAPFGGQPGNAEQRAALVQRKAQWREELDREGLATLRQRYEAAMLASPGDWRLINNWAEILMNAEEYGESERLLRREIDLLPHRFDVRAGLALLLGYEGRAEEGVQALRDAPGKHGHFVAEFLLSTARTLGRDRRLLEALVFAQAAVAESPKNADAMLELAARHAALGHDQDAERCLRSVLDREPGHVTARDELTAFLALRGRWDEAEQILLAQGTDPATRLKHAQLLMARGDLVGADKDLSLLEASAEATGEVSRVREQWRALRKY